MTSRAKGGLRVLAVFFAVWLLIAAAKHWHARQTWYRCTCIICSHDPYWGRVYGDMEANYTQSAKGAGP